MAGSFVGSALLAGGTSFSSSAVASCQSGDIALLFLADDQTTDCNVTTGWTAVLDLQNGYSETSAYIGFWIKKLTSSDCSASISNTTSSTSGILAVFRDTDVDTIIAAIADYYASSGKNIATSPSSSSITNGTFASGDISVIVGLVQDSTDTISSPGGGWTSPTNWQDAGGSGSTSSVTVLNYRTGATGTLTPGAWTGQSSGNFLTCLHIRLPAAASGTTGTITATEAADTASLSGDVLVQGAISATEATDTAAIAGDVLVQGTIAATETGDTAAFAGDVIVQGTIAATDSADTAAFAGNVVVQGTIAATDAPDTAALAGTVLVQGTIGATEVPDTASIDGAVLVQGTIAATEPTDTAALAGDVIVSGALSATEGSDTASFTGTVSGQATGTISATEAPDTASVSGEVLVQGTLAANDNADTAAFTGLVLVQGSLDATEESDTATFTGLGALATRVATAPHANDSITFARPSPVTNTRPGMVASSRPAAAGGSRPRQASTGVR